MDFSDARPAPEQLQAAGRQFVVRYIGARFGAKAATRAELDGYDQAEIGVALNYEGDTDGLKGGAAYARQVVPIVREALTALGRGNAVVYHSADWDVQTRAELDAIDDAFGVYIAEFGEDHLGVYGPYNVVKYLADRHPGLRLWQTYGWSKGRFDHRAHLYQYANGQKVGGQDVDFTRMMRPDAGVTGVLSLTPITGGRNTTSRPTKDIQKLVGATPDGAYGDETSTLVAGWQVGHDLAPDGTWGPMSDKVGFPK